MQRMLASAIEIFFGQQRPNGHVRFLSRTELTQKSSFPTGPGHSRTVGCGLVDF
jgi:hypothetical protein